MTFNKSILAVAIAVAISSPTIAGTIEIESTDKEATYSLSNATISVYDGTVGFEDFTNKGIGYDSSSGNGDAENLGYKNKSLSISGTIDMIDVELKSDETLGSGAAADNPHGLEFKNAKSERTYIETNGATINTDGSGNAINITNSTLDVFATDEKGNKVEPILIYNNGGKITALSSTSSLNDAIAITGSTVNGNILNGSTARTNDLGQAQPATSGTIAGVKTGIRINNTKFSGSIINEKGSLIDGDYGISVESSSRYKGDIDNIGTITGSMKGINLSGNTQFNGEINNTGIIAGGNSSDRDYGIFIDDNVTGKVVINQRDGELSGYTALRMNKNTKANFTGGKITGNVENNGGRFYVEGAQSITGDYLQTAGSSLVMGMHNKDTHLTATNITLAKDSTVVIDFRGNMYVKDGDKLTILAGTAGIEDNGAKYIVNSNLVTVAKTETNADGTIELVFERSAITDYIENNIKNGKIKGQAISNMRALAKAATDNDYVVKLIDEHGENALPDVSGASVAAAIGASNQSNTQISVRARSLASGDALDNSGMWVQGLVSKGDQDNRNGEAYDTKSHGFVLGADTELADGLVVGGAYTFITSDSTTKNSNTESDYHMATAYAAQAIDQILLDGQAYYAWGDNDARRDVGASANYDSSLYGARVGAGYQLDIAPATRLVPTLSLEASRLSVDGYTESGTGALKVDSQDFNRLELGLNTELSKDYQFRNATLVPSVNLGVFHDFEGKAQNSTISFTDPGAAGVTPITIAGTKPEKTRYVAGVGLDIMSGENLTVSAEYNYNWNGDGFDANAGALKFRWDF